MSSVNGKFFLTVFLAVRDREREVIQFSVILFPITLPVLYHLLILFLHYSHCTWGCKCETWRSFECASAEKY